MKILSTFLLLSYFSCHPHSNEFHKEGKNDLKEDKPIMKFLESTMETDDRLDRYQHSEDKEKGMFSDSDNYDRKHNNRDMKFDEKKDFDAWEKREVKHGKRNDNEDRHSRRNEDNNEIERINKFRHEDREERQRKNVDKFEERRQHERNEDGEREYSQNNIKIDEDEFKNDKEMKNFDPYSIERRNNNNNLEENENDHESNHKKINSENNRKFENLKSEQHENLNDLY